MRILILGGTVFLGRHTALAAIARGHDVTLFHRGTHPLQADLAGVKEILGDRTVSLDALVGQTWDAVIDTSGYFPRHVRASVGALRDQAPCYLFVSTISVYDDSMQPGQDEFAAPLAQLADPTVEVMTGEVYGGLKVLCEAAVRETHGDHALIVRPGLIVGPDDPTDRFTYWPARVARGGEVLAPERPAAPAQYIDARDLGEWMVTLAEQQASGIYNAVGPAALLTFDELLTTCQQVTGSDATFTWIPTDFLVEQNVQPWSDLPVWIPASEAPGMAVVANQRAIAAGLRFRPLADTAAATLAWLRQRSSGPELHAGLSAEREQAVLAAWHARMV